MAALAGLPQVEAVTFERRDDSFTVRYRGEALRLGPVAAAVQTAVVGKPIRRLLDRLRRRLTAIRRRRPPRPPDADGCGADTNVVQQPTRR